MHHKSQTWQTTLSWCQRCPSSKMTHVLPRILNSATYYHTTPTTTATTQFKQFSYSLWVQFQLGPSRALCLMTRSSARSATLTLIRLKTFSDTSSYSLSDLKVHFTTLCNRSEDQNQTSSFWEHKNLLLLKLPSGHRPYHFAELSPQSNSPRGEALN